MPKLPRISGAKTIKALERLGYIQVRQRGSHVVLRKELPEGAIGCVVPLHNELAVGTLKGILNQAKVASQNFLDKL